MIILIDSNYVAYFHSFRQPLFHEGRSVGIVFGFLKTLLFLAKTFETNRFVFAWDSRRSIRQAWLPTYKESRRAEKDRAKAVEDFRQFDLLRRFVLPQFGFRNIFLKSGFEGDDIIATLCKGNPDEEIVIVSSDNDLYQLLSPLHFMYNLKTKKRYTDHDFGKEWGIEPALWADVKSIAGCSGDNVPGVDGVGNKTAIKYLKGEMSEKSKVFERIEQAYANGDVGRTRNLVELPFPGLGTIGLCDDERFSVKDFLDICDKYGFKSFIAQLPIWQDYFGMKGRR